MMEPVFYDCEASALEGVPIEIGWAFIEEASSEVRSESHLILPAPNWATGDLWDPDAEKLHGITRFDLRRGGKSVKTIALRMNAVLKGRYLFADDCRDESWLRQIFEAAGVDPDFTIQAVKAQTLISRQAEEAGLSPEDLARVKAQVAALMPRCHRAEADSRHLAFQWKMVTLSPRSVSGAG